MLHSNRKYILLISLLFTLESLADEWNNFRSIANSTIATVRNGAIKDIEKLLKMQQQLIQLGIEACLDYAKIHPEDTAIMEVVIQNADVMKTLTLQQIENQWHSKQALLDKGINPKKLDHNSLTGNLIDTVIHPATAYIALDKFKKTGDKKLLERVDQELSELLFHLDQIR